MVNMRGVYKFHDLQISAADFSVLLFALKEELRIDQRLLHSFPDESDDIAVRIGALERLVHVFEDTGEYVG